MKHNKSLSQLLQLYEHDCIKVSKVSGIPLYKVERASCIILGKEYTPPTKPDIQTLSLHEKFNFGKHIGNTLVNVINHDPQYLRWLLNNSMIKLDDSVKFH